MNQSQNEWEKYRSEYEQEVDLRDLIFYCFYRWRSILLIALAGCILASIYAADKTKVAGSGLNLWQQLWGGGNSNLTRWAATGFVIGIFAGIFCYAICYTISDKIRGERELKERYGYHLLGVFYHRKRRRFLSCIDCWLRKWERYSGQVTEEETYRIVAANITNLAKEGGMFLVTGTVAPEKIQEFIGKIISQLNENVILAAGYDMNENADTLETLAECDAVILIEERDKSLRKKIQNEQDSIVALGKRVIGYVLI